MAHCHAAERRFSICRCRLRCRLFFFFAAPAHQRIRFDTRKQNHADASRHSMPVVALSMRFRSSALLCSPAPLPFDGTRGNDAAGEVFSTPARCCAAAATRDACSLPPTPPAAVTPRASAAHYGMHDKDADSAVTTPRDMIYEREQQNRTYAEPADMRSRNRGDASVPHDVIAAEFTHDLLVAAVTAASAPGVYGAQRHSVVR